MKFYECLENCKEKCISRLKIKPIKCLISGKKANWEIAEFTDIGQSVCFVYHIQKHLKAMKSIGATDLKVLCKICNKSIDEIYQEEIELKEILK